MIIAVISMIRDNWGGSEELWAAMAKEALQQDHKVLHLSYKVRTRHRKMNELNEKGLIVFSRSSYIPKYKRTTFQFIHKGLNFVKKKVTNSINKIFQHKPDIIVYNGTCYSIAEEKILLSNLQKSNTDFFIIGHFNDERGGISEKEIKIIKDAYKRSKKVLFISERSLQNARRHLSYNIPNAIVVRNPVNLLSTEILSYPENNIIQMALVGNLRVIHKGQDIVLEILSSVKWIKRNWHLNIYGSGEDEEHLKDLVNYYELQNKVTFHGRVNDIRAVWQNNNILLMPSHMEGMPLAVVEAMICGRPCVATDVGGNKEWITEGVEGFIASAATISSFEEAMDRAWKLKENWKGLGISAHEKAMKLYDPKPGKTLLEIITS